MAIREPVDDLYAALGVSPRATGDEIAAAFRARARELHPDVNPGAEAESEESFKRVSMAYRVLSDPARRARYDSGRHRAAAPGPAPSFPSRAAGARPHITRRGARLLLWGGIVLVLLGLAAGTWVVSLQRHDADLRARGVPVEAMVVDVGGERMLEFTTRDGRTVRSAERAKSGEAQPAPGAQVAIYYDRARPTRIVTEQSHTGRDVTLWTVAVKLAVGGGVLAFVGARRLRRKEPATAG